MTEGGVSRLEVFSGTGRRRTWSPEAKALIVAESCAPGVSVSAVARRYAMMPSQLFAWRREGREPLGAETSQSFATVAVDAPTSGVSVEVEVEYGGAVVRVGPGVHVDQLVTVFRALRVAS